MLNNPISIDMHLCKYYEVLSKCKGCLFTYLRWWMYWHLDRASKHSNSIEHAPKSKPMPLSRPELTTKARASMSFGDSQILRSSRVGLTLTTCFASMWSWLSWMQWQSCNSCVRVKRKDQEKSDRKKCMSGFSAFYLWSSQGVTMT